MRNITKFSSVILVFSALVEVTPARSQVSFLEPFHQADLIDGLQMGTSFVDSTARLTFIFASAVQPFYLFADFKISNFLGRDRARCSLPTFGLAYTPIRLGNIHISTQLSLEQNEFFNVTGLVGQKVGVLAFNLGYTIKYSDHEHHLKRAFDSYFSNLRFDIHDKITLEVEAIGQVDGDDPWPFLPFEKNRWNVALSYEPYENLYMSALFYEIDKVTNRGLAVSYIFPIN